MPVQPSRYRFGPFELLPGTRELYAKGRRLKLRHQTYHVLLMLLERAGDAVTREELRARVWASDTFVDSEHGLNTAIKELRAALSDSATSPQYIETLPKLGYRMIVPVVPETAMENGSLRPASTHNSVAESHDSFNNFPSTLKSGPVVTPVYTTASSMSGESSERRWLYILVAAAIVAVAAFAVLARWKFRPAARDPLRLTQLTAQTPENPVLTTAISRDGRFMAYSLKEGIYVQEIKTGETHHLPDTAGFSVDDWFSGDTQILANTEKDLWKISLVLGEKQKIASNVVAASISPDDSQILFRREFPTNALWVMPASGGVPNQLFGVPPGEGIGGAAWSPNSKQIAYVRRSAQWKFFLEIFDLETHGRKIILNDPTLAATPGEQMVWLPQGKLMLALRSTESTSANRSNLASIPVDERGVPTGKPVRLALSSETAIEQLSATSDGKRLIAAVARNPFALFLADLNLVDARVQNAVRISNDNWNNFPVGWTPDSKQLLYGSPNAQTPHIQRFDLRNQSSVVVMSRDHPFSSATLTPDGLWLLYLSREQTASGSISRHLMRRPSGGGPEELVLSSETLYSLRCPYTVLQACVYGESDSKAVRLSTLDPLKGKLADLLDVPLKDERIWLWDISPDRSALALFLYGAKEVQVLDLTSRHANTFDTSAFLTSIQAVQWSPDGKFLLASGFFSNHGRIVEIDLRGNTRLLLENPNRWMSAPTPSPDGGHLAYTAELLDMNVTLFENF